MPESPRSPSPEKSAESQLIDNLRREQVDLEIKIMELQDTVLAKDTARADAVALLCQSELMLEGKIGYIVELDRALNQRIRELENECDRKTEEIDRRGRALTELQSSAQRAQTDRDQTLAALHEKLDLANREIGNTHDLARGFVAERDQALDQQRRMANELEAQRQKLAAHQEEIILVNRRLEAAQAENTDLEHHRNTLGQKIADLQTRLTQTDSRLTEIKSSRLWRWTKPWRVLWGPKG